MSNNPLENRHIVPCRVSIETLGRKAMARNKGSTRQAVTYHVGCLELELAIHLNACQQERYAWGGQPDAYTPHFCRQPKLDIGLVLLSATGESADVIAFQASRAAAIPREDAAKRFHGPTR